MWIPALVFVYLCYSCCSTQLYYLGDVCKDDELQTDCSSTGLYMPDKVKATEIITFRRKDKASRIQLPKEYIPKLMKLVVHDIPQFLCENIESTKQDLVKCIHGNPCRVRENTLWSKILGLSLKNSEREGLSLQQCERYR